MPFHFFESSRPDSVLTSFASVSIPSLLVLFNISDVNARQACICHFSCVLAVLRVAMLITMLRCGHELNKGD